MDISDNVNLLNDVDATPREPFPIPDINETKINPLPGDETNDEQINNLAETLEKDTANLDLQNIEEQKEPENEENTKIETDDTIKEGTELYYCNDNLNYEFETVKLDEEKTGCWLYLTTKTAEKICLEDWEDKFVYKYVVQESFDVPDEQRKETEQCLYKELEIDTTQDKQIFILEQDLSKLKVQDHYLLKHDFLAKSLNIEERRFAVIEQGQIVCSADKSVVKTPKPENNEAGCFFYVTTILPEESVLQDWEDKTLNVYYFNEPMILPYGADNNPDPFFNDIYIDKIDNGDGTEDRIFSYYDDTVMGEYLKNEPKTAEIFLVEADLKKLSYYGSYDLKLDNVKFIHHIDKPMYD